jgi:hypothetical protein
MRHATGRIRQEGKTMCLGRQAHDLDTKLEHRERIWVCSATLLHRITCRFPRPNRA